MFLPIPILLSPLSLLGLKSLKAGGQGGGCKPQPCPAKPEPCQAKPQPCGNTVKFEGKITYGH